MPSSRRSSQPRVWTRASCIDRWVLYTSTIWEALISETGEAIFRHLKRTCYLEVSICLEVWNVYFMVMVKLPSTNQLPRTVDNHQLCWLLKFLAMCSWHLRLLDISVLEKIPEREMLNMMYGASLVVQWLRLCTPDAGVRVQLLVRKLDPTCCN